MALFFAKNDRKSCIFFCFAASGTGWHNVGWNWRCALWRLSEKARYLCGVISNYHYDNTKKAMQITG
jgi:hypothetical protein